MEPRKVLLAGLVALPGLLIPCLTVAADDGGKVFANACTACHTAKKLPLDKKRLTRDEWNEAVGRMISYGAEIPKGKLPELLDYLVKIRAPSGATDEGKK